MEGAKLPERILACVDGSEFGYKAADYAQLLAGKLNSNVIFLNVVGASAAEHEYNISADMVGSFQRMGQEALAKCEKKARAVGINFRTVQLEGDPVLNILDYAQKTSCDCIVVGKRGMGKIEKLILGSVSQKILEGSPVPVIVVK